VRARVLPRGKRDHVALVLVGPAPFGNHRALGGFATAAIAFSSWFSWYLFASSPFAPLVITSPPVV
jgi:hypothetical protein